MGGFPDAMQQEATPEPAPEPETKKKKKKKKRKADDDSNDMMAVDIAEMDAQAAGPSAPQQGGEEEEEDWDGTEEMRKRVLNKYLDEMHKLDFNDMVKTGLACPRIC